MSIRYLIVFAGFFYVIIIDIISIDIGSIYCIVCKTNIETNNCELDNINNNI